MAFDITETMYLEINGIPLATRAWRILDLTPLYGIVNRGISERMPYTSGSIGYRHRIDYQSVTLPIDVYGRHTPYGTIIADHWAGLDTNIGSLVTNVATPGTSTYPAIWHRFAGGTLTADVFVESFTPTQWAPGVVRFDLEMSIPAGKFA